MKHLPNFLTILRIVLTFLFVFFVLQPGFIYKVYAAIVFFVAALTDFLDGYLARKLRLVTSFGKLMDPVADKFLILAAFFVLTQKHVIAFWMFVLVFCREVLITAHRIYRLRKKEVIAAETAGKVKTVLQIVVISASLLYLVLSEKMYIKFAQHWIFLINAAMMLVVVVTIYSGLRYLQQNKNIKHA